MVSMSGKIIFCIFLLSSPPSRVYFTLTASVASHNISTGSIVNAKISL
jgi:hypothetical protein